MDTLYPNRVVSSSAMRILIVGQAILFLMFWMMATPPVIPKPAGVLSSLADLAHSGLFEQIEISLTLYAEAVLCSTLVSLFISISTAMAFFRPVASVWSTFRFLSTVGLPFFLTLYIHSAHNLKLVVETFSISVFFVTGLLDVYNQIPREKYDLARTLRMSEWRVVWEVMFLGRVDVAFDVLRSNAAIGWMMLPMVEGLWRSEGGIGTLLDIQSRHFGLDAIAAIQLTILLIGILQDYLLGVIKKICCPYANLLLERR